MNLKIGQHVSLKHINFKDNHFGQYHTKISQNFIFIMMTKERRRKTWQFDKKEKLGAKIIAIFDDILKTRI